ncbi:L-asparaginase [Austwickia chelonae]|uniref:asparaginase n=1 Tax=Austwickia chelonae NBRC 105200 TaxID=1184607 RepID=K6VRW1_9MICO|nr:asparaginase [Austwickia chelonae]GAB78070.1 putative L-asparaginase [Austwickia chelonae NBRC 105200]SEV95661.1 L-asparaginase [Austwickia chelonae]
MTAADALPPRPRILILATGGTIAGASDSTETVDYTAGVIGVAELVQAVPDLTRIAEISHQQLWQLDSVDMDPARQLELVRQVRAQVARPDVDGVVVTHGTDTLEESAYLLDLLVGSPKPVVVVGAMRPADALGADGPVNLRHAVIVAASPSSCGLGVLVVVGEEIHAARSVGKVHTTRTNAFASPHGPLGEVVAERACYFRTPHRSSAVDGTAAAVISAVGQELPAVEVVQGRAGLPQQMLQAVLESGAAGVVYVGHGAGNVPSDVLPRLGALVDAGVVVMRASRVCSGPVTRGGAVDDDRYGFVAAGDLTPQQGRISLAVALAQSRDPRQVQKFVDTH